MKMIKNLSTAGMHHILWDAVSCGDQGPLQGWYRRVNLGASPGLKDGSHREIHRVEIRAAGGQHLLGPERQKNFRTELLDQTSSVGRSSIMLENVGVVPIGGKEPGHHVLLRRGSVLVLVEF